MRKQLCCHEIWSRDTLGKVPTPTAAEPFKALACLVSRTEPGSETGEQNGWHYANLGNLNRGILQMDRFDVCFFWNLEPLEVGRREVWRSVNDRRTVWVSLGRPTNGEGMLHILVHIYIYSKCELCFARKSDHSFCPLPSHLQMQQMEWIPAAGDAACVALREPNQRSKKLKKSVDAMDIYLNSNCRDQQRRERERSYKHIKTYHILTYVERCNIR